MRYGLIGESLKHSYSKTIHEMLGKYGYDLLEAAPEGLRDIISDKRYAGFNVTIPYKETVMDFCAELSPEAREIGCVNTLLRLPGGGLLGHNTDFEGFCEMARRAGVAFAGKKVLIFGSGGTSKTARAAAAAGGAAEIMIVSRRGKVTYESLAGHRDAQVIINTTPVGMYPKNGEGLVSLERFPKLTGVLDVIYNPLKTRLVLQAETLGIPCSGGLYMLVRQAVAAAALFTGGSLMSEAESIYGKICRDTQNIILIGMPGCGKTRLGGLIAKALGRELLDTDLLVEEKAKISIPGIFEKHGEARFRELEREAVAGCGKRTGMVIATGGGAPLYEENRLNLRQNGKIFLIRRDMEKLPTQGRPLSKDRETLRGMELERMPVYEAFADAVIDNNGSPEVAVSAILEEFQ